MAQVPDPKLKYQQLLSYAKKLPPLPAEEHTDDNKVRGCVSQVRCLPVHAKLLSATATATLQLQADLGQHAQLFSLCSEEGRTAVARARTQNQFLYCVHAGMGGARGARGQNLLARGLRLCADKGRRPLPGRLTRHVCCTALRHSDCLVAVVAWQYGQYGQYSMSS